MLSTLLLAGAFDGTSVTALANPPASRSVDLVDVPASPTIWRKYDAEVLDYRLGFAGRLHGDTIVSVTVAATEGLVVSDTAYSNDAISFWLSDGTPPALAIVVVVIATASGRTLEAKVAVQVAA